MRNHTRARSRRRPTTRIRKAYLRGKLLEKRQKLLTRLISEIESASAVSGNIYGDIVDIAMSSAAQEEHFLAGTAESDTVAEIDRALERIEDGTYGVCEDCRRRIPQLRLKVVPFASLCVQCQETREREQAAADGDSRWLDNVEDDLGEDMAVPVFLRGSRPGNG